MELVIHQHEGLEDPNFIDYLCSVVRVLILNSGIDFTRFSQVFKDEFNDFSVSTILLLATKNLIVLDYKTYVIIRINPNSYIPGSFKKIIDACRILNYGTLDISGTYIFSDVFDYVAHNINQIYLTYILEM